ncbi:MAG: amidohydrolase family protein [Candidatus Sungbacteria bacterium]|uniref:Amidohydrolase family protein n=1 Tax=Candidatus Sungiibacteriota bacterium TaxID=2750080 RepID=A0A932R025_9BACT|nr:amidohydrolase family protein [Candidatus Sungbacteria bacterium]
MSTLFFNGNFYVGRGRRAAAVLVGKDGFITEVFGKIPDPALRLRPDVRQKDLGGVFVFPAFEDAHNHPAGRARAFYELDFRASEVPWGDVKKAIRERSRIVPAGQWIVCHGWSEKRWGKIAADELDEISPAHAVLLIHVSYHGGVVNKRGLSSLAEQGIVVRDPAAQETGRVTEEDFENVMAATAGDSGEYQKAIPMAAGALLKKGIVAAHDMNVTTFDQLDAYRELARSGALSIASALYIHSRLLRDEKRILSFVRDMQGDIEIFGLKLFLDGVIGTSTAAVSRAYRDGTGWGALRMHFSECKTLVRKAASVGLRHIAMHCIGDRAADFAVDVFEKLRKEYWRDITTWRLEHFEMPSERAIRALARSGGVASMQPNFNWDVAAYETRLGRDAQRLNPFRKLKDAGVTIAFGSDGMPSGPVAGIRWATLDAPFGHQRLTIDEAVEAYTIVPASLAGMDHVRGRIAKGYEANFAVFAQDPFHNSSGADDGVPRALWRRGVQVAGDA